MNSTTHRRKSLRIELPCHDEHVRVPVRPDRSFVVKEHGCPKCGKAWTVAIDYEFGEGRDGQERTFAYSEWMREGRTSAPVTFEIVRARADGWFRADIWGIQQKRQELRWRKKESFKRIALARQRGVHVLSCDRCEIASPLDAAGWRLVHEGNELQAFCPGCFPLASAETTRGRP
jgi:hypothetical protein